MTQALRLVLSGPPGAGKGTQAQLLAEHLGLTCIGSGELFRLHLQQRTPLGLRAAEYMNQGLLVPDEVTIDIILEKVLSLEAKEGFILDGFPRTPNQADALDEALKRRSRGLDRVIHIEVLEAELLRRLGGRYSCSECQSPHAVPDAEVGAVPRCQRCGGELYQREDDSPEAVKQRIRVYQEETMPVLDFYRTRSLLYTVQGDGSVESVNHRVLKALGRVPKSADTE